MTDIKTAMQEFRDRTHYMVDIETLSITPHWSCITSIGIAALRFTPELTYNVSLDFVARMDSPSERLFRERATHANDDTVRWRQENKVGEMELALPEVAPHGVATEITQRIQQEPDAYWWARRMRFDFGFIDALLSHYAYGGPIDCMPFRNTFDQATVVELLYARYPKENLAHFETHATTAAKNSCEPLLGKDAGFHSAPYDAVYQAYMLAAGYCMLY